jgi:hypothetical protein
VADVQTTTENRRPVVPTGCCVPFDASLWNDREVIWRDRLFVRRHVRGFLHVPIGLGKIVTTTTQRIAAAGASPSPAPGLMLGDETSLWGSELYLEATKPVPGADMARLSGTFLTRVYDGPFKDAGKWAKDMKRHAASKGRTLDKLYFGYTTCPKCAKAYGHNYVVLFARVGDAPRA